jgi:hypothetical protein
VLAGVVAVVLSQSFVESSPPFPGSAFYGAQSCAVASDSQSTVVLSNDWREELTAQRWFEPLANPTTVNVYPGINAPPLQRFKIQHVGLPALASVGVTAPVAGKVFVLLWVDPADGGLLQSRQLVAGTQFAPPFAVPPDLTNVSAAEVVPGSLVWAGEVPDGGVVFGTLGSGGWLKLSIDAVEPGSLRMTRDPIGVSTSLTADRVVPGESYLFNFTPAALGGMSGIPISTGVGQVRALGMVFFSWKNGVSDFSFGSMIVPNSEPFPPSSPKRVELRTAS